MFYDIYDNANYCGTLCNSLLLLCCFCRTAVGPQKPKYNPTCVSKLEHYRSAKRYDRFVCNVVRMRKQYTLYSYDVKITHTNHACDLLI